MTTFYFVRHGQTEINLANRLNGGSVDSPLTAAGVDGATTVGRVLATHQFTQVVCSSMPRTQRTTALIMAENQFRTVTPVQPVDGLREMNLGDWDGHRIADLADQAQTALYFHDPLAFDAHVAPAIHSETYAAVRQRSRAVIDAAYAAHPDGRILVVAHGVVFLVLLNDLLGRPLARLREWPLLANTTVTKLQTSDGHHYTVSYRDRLPAVD
ncbi:histidine phosphatase family protein [Lacticaseibacillus absianus]|uniref:histidine phosphatase family protein n=1 Tax=Lacticaseibacillus absianus TaxID=2729623 RepID=UPI0015CD9114